MSADLLDVGATLSNSFHFAFQPEYGYVLIIATVLAFELILIGFAAGRKRSSFFTEEFMKKNFGEEHKKATNNEITKGGYPDAGNGRYASKLTYQQWYQFNSAQRAHYNFLEWAPANFVFLFVSGLYFPIPAAVLGLVIAIGRVMYAVGYITGGPKGRIVGAIINDLATLGHIGLSFASGIMFTCGKNSQ